MTKSTTTTEIEMGDHPIAQGLPATLVLFDAAGPETISTTAFFPGLTSAGNEPGTGNPMILTADVGEAVDPGALVPGDAAPARRVMLPWTDNTMASFTPDGFRLFGNAMDWAVGRLGPSGDDLRVTEIVYDNSSDPGNIIVTLTFTSELDKQYTLYTSTDFSAPIADRTDLDDSIDGGDGSATFVVDFDLFGLPTSDPRRFFVFRENP